MKNIRYLSLIIIVILLLYLMATALFSRLFQMGGQVLVPTRPPAPTFTSVPVAIAPTLAVIPTFTPSPMLTPTLPPTPSPTPTPLPFTPTLTPTDTRTPQPQAIAASTVNLRAGPGTNYPIVGSLPPNTAAPIVGRSADASWWQLQEPTGQTAWVAASVVQASQTENVPVVVAPPPPATPTPAPTPVPTKPPYQYEPTGWFGDRNYGLTRFLGTITDVNGNPVNGVYVQASCGDFSVISNASGTTGWPAGFYDITLDTKPIVCDWGLMVVETDDQRTVKAALSELVTVQTTIEQSIVTANWRKNW
jgi:uncharacterized protein YgiM (DUF1202 family)